MELLYPAKTWTKFYRAKKGVKKSYMSAICRQNGDSGGNFVAKSRYVFLIVE